MTRGVVSIDPQASDRQRRFDQQVRQILNDLILAGALVLGTTGTWTITGVGDAASVLSERVFAFQPQYGMWGG